MVVGRQAKSTQMNDSRKESQEKEARTYEEKCYYNVEKSDGSNIIKVPNKLRKVENDAYSPRLVSIGIYHQEKYDLAAMQELNFRYRKYFLKRLEESAASLWNFQNFLCFHDKVTSSYPGKIQQSLPDFVGPVLLDGCFILELFIRYYLHCSLNMMLEEQYDDLIFKFSWMIPTLRQDLSFVENQIPFFILQMLFEAIEPHLKAKGIPVPNSLTSLALNFFEPAAMKNQVAVMKRLGENQTGGKECHKHLLDLLHKFYRPSSDFVCVATNQPKSTNYKHLDGAGEHSSINFLSNTTSWGFDFCASEILDSGIDLELQSSEDHLLNITFSKGVIRMPSVFIDDTANLSVLRNLVAYEQYSVCSNHFTSYAILLKSLIRTPKDIKILQERRIINSNYWMDNEEYLAQCNTILTEVFVKDFCFGDLCDLVNARTRKFWFRRYIRSLYRTYFSKAWSMVSFIAAFCLFVLTVIQTYFAIRPAR